MWVVPIMYLNLCVQVNFCHFPLIIVNYWQMRWREISHGLYGYISTYAPGSKHTDVLLCNIQWVHLHVYNVHLLDGQCKNKISKHSWTLKFSNSCVVIKETQFRYSQQTILPNEGSWLDLLICIQVLLTDCFNYWKCRYWE